MGVAGLLSPCVPLGPCSSPASLTEGRGPWAGGCSCPGPLLASGWVGVIQKQTRWGENEVCVCTYESFLSLLAHTTGRRGRGCWGPSKRNLAGVSGLGGEEGGPEPCTSSPKLLWPPEPVVALSLLKPLPWGIQDTPGLVAVSKMGCGGKWGAEAGPAHTPSPLAMLPTLSRSMAPELGNCFWPRSTSPSGALKAPW